MKVTYIANARIPTEKAHGVQIMRMCEAFAALGNDVTLVAPWRFNPLKKHDPYSYYGVKRNFRIVRLPSIDLTRFGKIGFYIQTLTFAESVFWYLLFTKHDLIYSRDEWALWYRSSVRGDFVWEVHTKHPNSWVVQRVLKKAKAIIAISKGLKDLYVSYAGDVRKIHIAHDGVSLAQFDQLPAKQEARKNIGIPLDARVVGYVGKYKTMGEGKGVDELLEAFAAVLPEVRDAQLMLVGINANEEETIRTQLRKFKIQETKVRLVQHVPQPMIPMYLAACDTLVMNYPKTEHYATYMSPLKLFEYMASGVPIVTTDLVTVREVLTEQEALFVAPDDSHALAATLARVLHEPGAYAKVGENARERVKKYSWEARARNILESIKNPMLPRG